MTLPEPEAYDLLRTAGATPPLYELEPSDTSAQAFHDSINAHQVANPHDGSVAVHSVDEYRHIWLSTIDDGKSSFTLHDSDELVSVFSAISTGPPTTPSIASVTGSPNQT